MKCNTKDLCFLYPVYEIISSNSSTYDFLLALTKPNYENAHNKIVDQTPFLENPIVQIAPSQNSSLLLQVVINFFLSTGKVELWSNPI